MADKDSSPTPTGPSRTSQLPQLARTFCAARCHAATPAGKAPARGPGDPEAAAVHRRSLGRRPVHRLLGHGDELLGEVDPAAQRRPMNLSRATSSIARWTRRSSVRPTSPTATCRSAPICGMPLSVRKKAEAAKLPAGHHGPGATFARTDSIGRHQDRGRRVSAHGPADQDGRATSRSTRAGCRGSSAAWRATWRSSRGQDLHLRSQGRPAGGNLQPGAVQYGPRACLGAAGAGGMGDLAAAARTKLLLLGVSPQEIDRMVAAGQPRRGW